MWKFTSTYKNHLDNLPKSKVSRLYNAYKKDKDDARNVERITAMKIKYGKEKQKARARKNGVTKSIIIKTVEPVQTIQPIQTIQPVHTIQPVQIIQPVRTDDEEYKEQMKQQRDEYFRRVKFEKEQTASETRDKMRKEIEQEIKQEKDKQEREDKEEIALARHSAVDDYKRLLAKQEAENDKALNKMVIEQNKEDQREKMDKHVKQGNPYRHLIRELIEMNIDIREVFITKRDIECGMYRDFLITHIYPSIDNIITYMNTLK